MSSSSESSEYLAPVKIGRALGRIEKGDMVIYDPPDQIVSSDHLPTFRSYKSYMKKHKNKRRK